MLVARMIEQIAVDALTLRSQLPEFTLRVGGSVVARVAAREAGHGVIVLAGVPLVAKLPPEVQAGQTLHSGSRRSPRSRSRCGSTSRPCWPPRRPRSPPRRRRPALAVERAAAARRPGRGVGHGVARVRLRGARPARPAPRPRPRDRERERRRAAGRRLDSPPRRPAGSRTRSPSGPAAPRRSASPHAASRWTRMPDERRVTALRYEGDGAPKVVASGRGHVAEKILARRAGRGRAGARGSRSSRRRSAAWRWARRSPRSCGSRWRRCSRGPTNWKTRQLPRIGDVGVPTLCRYQQRPVDAAPPSGAPRTDEDRSRHPRQEEDLARGRSRSLARVQGDRRPAGRATAWS